MLRAIRFAAELEFDIEEKTKQAMEPSVHRLNDTRETNGKIEYVVPRETVGNELAKALTRNPAQAILWLEKTGTLDVIFGKPTPERKRKDHLQNLPKGQPTFVTALLLLAYDRDAIPSLLMRSGLDSLPRGTTLRIETSDVLWFIDRLTQPWDEKMIKDLRASTFEKHFMNGRGELLIQAFKILQTPKLALVVSDRAEQIRNLWSIEKNEPIHALLSGNDILDAGIPAGPQVRYLLEELRDLQLEGNILTREQAKRWLKTKIPS